MSLNTVKVKMIRSYRNISSFNSTSFSAINGSEWCKPFYASIYQPKTQGGQSRDIGILDDIKV